MNKSIFYWKSICFAISISFLWGSNCFSQTSFNDIASQVGIDISYGEGFYAGGVSFYDFNGDGWDDLSLASESSNGVNFFLNNNGQFEAISFQGINNNLETKHILWVDYNNDGDLDLFITSITTNHLYENLGEFVFKDVTNISGLSTAEKESYVAVWGDYNNDGWLDLYVTNYDGAKLNRLYKNNWDGTFDDVSLISKTHNFKKRSFCAVFVDYNNDNLQDIYVANDRDTGNSLYRNNGDGSFEDVSLSSGSYYEMDAMGIAVGDVDNNGYFDLYISNSPSGNVFLKNQGDGTFDEVANQLGVGFNSVGWGTNFLDYDNDTDLDLYVSGNLIGSDIVSSAMFRNEGDYFITPDEIGFLGDTVSSYVNAIGDLNSDGYPDIVVNSENFPTAVWENSGGNKNWLKLNLEGVKSNKDGIGSKIILYLNQNAYYRQTNCGIGFMGQNSKYELFGLADYTNVDSIKIEWPSGHIDKLLNVSSNQLLKITEGSTQEIEISLSVNKSKSSICSNEKLLVSAGIHSSEYDFDWSNGAKTNVIELSEPGTYSVTISSKYLSNDIYREIKIDPFPNLDYKINFTNPTCSYEDNGEIIISINAGEPPYSIQVNEENKVTLNDAESIYKILDLDSGVYNLQLIDGNLCVYNSFISLNKPENILIETEVVPATNSQENGSITVNISGGSPPYSILFEGNEIANFSTIRNLSQGVYALQIIDDVGCSQSENVSIDVITGQAEDSKKESIFIYPNPTNECTFLVRDNLHQKIESLNVYNITGRLVKKVRIELFIDNEIKICLPKLSSGSYILTYSIKGEVIPLKLILNKALN